MWAWAGIHKALSLGWAGGGAAFIAEAHGRPGLRPAVAVAVPLVEISLGALALRRAWWPILRVAAPAMHLGILVTLLRADWNVAVWPWNLALAGAAPLLFAGPPASVRRELVRPAAAVLVTLPALFYVGVVDAYPAHNLYSSNTAAALVCTGSACAPAPFGTLDALDVPLPPEPRLYRRWFEAECRPGTVLQITGPRTRLTDPPRVERHACPAADEGPIAPRRPPR
jgi:hypothetical protein